MYIRISLTKWHRYLWLQWIGIRRMRTKFCSFSVVTLTCVNPVHGVLRLTQYGTYIYIQHKSVTNWNFKRKHTVWNMICVIKHISNKTIFEVLILIISKESPGEKLWEQNMICILTQVYVPYFKSRRVLSISA